MEQEQQKLHDAASRELTRLWRAWRTVKEMCQDRVSIPFGANLIVPLTTNSQGYELTEEEVRISLDDFRTQYSDPLGGPEYANPPFINFRGHTPPPLTNPPSRSRSKMTFSARPTLAMQDKHRKEKTSKNPEPDTDIGTIWVEFHPEPSIGIKQMRTFGHHIHEHNFHTGIMVTQNAITPAAMKIVPILLPHVVETFQEQDLLVNITHHELVPKHVLLSREEKKVLLERYRLKDAQLPRIQVNDPVARYLGLKKGQVVKIIRKSETAGRYASYRWVV